ncbi:MAG: ribonuclease H-like domain-containing protein [bacterium]
MNIQDKLRQIESLNLQKGISFQPNSTFISDHPIDQVLNGEIKETPYGSYFYYEEDYPFDYTHGIIQLAAFLNKPASLLSLIGKDPKFDDVDLKKVLFIDTETTGLSGGSGICAFLIGVGYFTENTFRLAQYFMNDFNNEYALLYDLNQFIANHQLLVSYNGKCYDIPLLESRNVFNQLKTPLSQILHLDLLHAVRRLWKQSLPDCSLTTAERQLLRASRKGDVPGSLIPQIYFDYLRNKDARALKPVFYHNQQDILTMVALITKGMQLFENPLEESENSVEILSLGRIYEGMIQLEQSIELYNNYLKNSVDANNRRELLFRTAFNYKRLKNWSQAVKVWQEYLAAESYHPLPYIELAKHYEHRDKNYAKAKYLVDKALEEINIVERLNGKKDWPNYKQDLEYRRKRLVKKMHKSSALSN